MIDKYLEQRAVAVLLGCSVDQQLNGVSVGGYRFVHSRTYFIIAVRFGQKLIYAVNENSSLSNLLANSVAWQGDVHERRRQ